MRQIYFVFDHIRIDGVRPWLERVADELAAGSERDVCRTKDAGAADVIIFMSIGRRRDRIVGGNFIKAHEIYRSFPEKSFLWSTEDNPLSYLPGLYASMPKRWFDPAIHRAFTYFELQADVDVERTPATRDISYNFIGGVTAHIRRDILSATHPADALVRETPNFNHVNPSAAHQKLEYAEVLTRSRFTLCPRGVGTSSHRLFEAMKFGSVPIIVSDELALPDGPDWTTCSLIVAEKDYLSIPEIVARAESRSAVMGRAASAYFDQFFSKKRMLTNIIRLTDELGAQRESAGNVTFALKQVHDLAERGKGRASKVLSELGRAGSASPVW